MTPPILGIWASQGKVQGNFESIATVTVGSGGQSSITFNSIPSTYKHLQIRGIARDNRASTWIDTLFIQCNSDTTAGNYYSHYLAGNGSSASSGAITGSGSPNAIGFGIGLTGAANVSTSFAPIIIDILDYSNTNKYKTFKTITGVEDNTNGSIRIYSGLWMSASALDSLTLQGGNAGISFQQYSHFALYGIKG